MCEILLVFDSQLDDLSDLALVQTDVILYHLSSILPQNLPHLFLMGTSPEVALKLHLVLSSLRTFTCPHSGRRISKKWLNPGVNTESGL